MNIEYVFKICDTSWIMLDNLGWAWNLIQLLSGWLAADCWLAAKAAMGPDRCPQIVDMAAESATAEH